MFEAEVFRQIMEFVHTGKVELQPRTIVGESFTLYFSKPRVYIGGSINCPLYAC